jgi:hypothetical protein
VLASSRCGRPKAAAQVQRSTWSCRMEHSDYLRSEAAKYRELAERTDDPVSKQEFLDLANSDEAASRIDDSLPGG